mgnify:CR=1 FL=1
MREQLDLMLASARLRDRAALRVLDRVLIAAPDEYEEIPEAFYASRILALADEGRIEARGNLEDPKAGEIRLASKPGAE